MHIFLTRLNHYVPFWTLFFHGNTISVDYAYTVWNVMCGMERNKVYVLIHANMMCCTITVCVFTACKKTFSLITMKARTACHIIGERENSRLDSLFPFYAWWVRSAVALCLPLKAVREFSATLAARAGTSTICDTKWKPHTHKKNIPFVGRCISSWHRRITARRTTFCFSVSSLHGCSHGFTPKTRKLRGLEALNWPMVWTWASRCVRDPCDGLTASSFPSFYPKM